MKKILLLGLTLSLTVLAQAQTGKWSWGAQASLGLSTVSNVYDVRLNSPSFGVGWQTLYSLDDHWQLGASLQLSRDGYKGSGTTNPSTFLSGWFEIGELNFTQKETINMLRLPLQLRYNWRSSRKKIRPYTYLGGSIGYRIPDNNTNNTAALTGNDDETRETFESFDFLYPRYSRLDYGLMAGAGLAFRTKRGPLITAELYYYQGLKQQSDIIFFLAEDKYGAGRHLQQQLRLQISIIDLL